MTKKCTKCGESKSIDEFCAMAKAPDGRHYWCRVCRSSYNRKWARDRPAYYQQNSRKMRARYPQRQRARSVVTQAIKMGRMPPANSLACVDCGTLAYAYDHNHGYEPPHELDVEPVCSRCHGLRSRARGEHASGSRYKPDGVQHIALPVVSP